MADAYEIPMLSDGAIFDYEQTTPLDGTDYIFHFSYNSRDGHWYLSLRTIDNEPIRGCESMKLVLGIDILRRVTDDRKPPGQLVVFSEFLEEPGLLSFGNDYTLMYLPDTEIAAYKATL